MPKEGDEFSPIVRVGGLQNKQDGLKLNQVNPMFDKVRLPQRSVLGKEKGSVAEAGDVRFVVVFEEEKVKGVDARGLDEFYEQTLIESEDADELHCSAVSPDGRYVVIGGYSRFCIVAI